MDGGQREYYPLLLWIVEEGILSSNAVDGGQRGYHPLLLWIVVEGILSMY